MESFTKNVLFYKKNYKVLFKKKNYKKSRRVTAKFFYKKVTEKSTYKIKQDGVRGNLGFPARMGW